MRTQVRDLDYDTPPALSRAVTISRAWNALQSDRSVPAIPVTNDDGTLYGMLSPSEIADYDMQTIKNTYAENLPIFNLLNVLDGKVLNEAGYLVDRVSGGGIPSRFRSRMRICSFPGRTPSSSAATSPRWRGAQSR